MLHLLVDTHVHYDDAAFDLDRDVLLHAQFSAGVEKIITSGFNVESSQNALRLASQYPKIYASVGVFPLEAHFVGSKWMEHIEQMASDPRCVAIGEIGLDYHSENCDSVSHSQKSIQKEVFIGQLKLAEKHDIPVVIHNREADADMLDILSGFSIKGVIHRFFSESEYGFKFIQKGLHLAIGPAITYPNAEHIFDVVQRMPLSHLLIETDGPFLPVAGREKERGVSSMLVDVCKVISSVRGDVSAEEVAMVTYENAIKLFGFHE